MSILKTRTRVQKLDRWMVNLSPLPTNAAAGRKQPKSRWKWKGKELFMQNYLSIGVDALVTYNFHKARENASGAWGLSGRLFNKLLYFVYGTKDVLERECGDLDRILEVRLDGRRVEQSNRLLAQQITYKRSQSASRGARHSPASYCQESGDETSESNDHE